ncbi:hypothetical protein F5879DRAFT_680864 [Lentinula edodes]|nr:hypothetical protein F5879DRAFT_680864 [Lentinula edodes]
MRFAPLYLSAIFLGLLSFACAFPMRVDPEHENVYIVKFKKSAPSASNEEVNKAAKDCVEGFLKQIHDAPGRKVTVSFDGDYSPDKLESVLHFEAGMTHWIDGKFPHVVDKEGWVMCPKDDQGKYHGSASPMALLRTNQNCQTCVNVQVRNACFSCVACIWLFQCPVQSGWLDICMYRHARHALS